jgi:glycosyltransferase involved in cell wall biosynthesis
MHTIRDQPLSSFAFSCLLPVYHRDDPDYLHDALLSIVENSLAPQRIIICEDGDIPSTLDTVIRAFQHFELLRVKNTGSRGLHHNLNNALSFVETPWLCRCDADDINMPDRFEKQVNYLRLNHNIDVLGTDIIDFDPDGRTGRKSMPVTPERVARWAGRRNPINHMTAFVRTEAIKACGGYPDVPFKEDYALWLTMLARGYQLDNIPEVLVRARMGKNFHARRAGWHNFRSEGAILKRKLSVPQISAADAITFFAIRSIILLGGASLTKGVYNAVLRQRI